ncbi:MAG: pilus (MSHA type) biogenesis protein MshL [Campylobacterales bacterium]
MRLIRYAPLLLSTLLVAGNCDRQLFTINAERGIVISEILEQLGVQCGFSIAPQDSNVTMAILGREMMRLSLNNVTLDELLDLLITENGLSYERKGSILKIWALETKSYRVDYLSTQRSGTSSTDITLSTTATSQTSTTSATGGTGGSESNSATSRSGIAIKSDDTFVFWDRLEKDLLAAANTAQDDYIVQAPIINKEAGLITVTATKKQHERIKRYLDNLLSRIQKQVMIDVKIFEVTLDGSKTTGIDWSQIFNFQNVTVGAGGVAQMGPNPATVAMTTGQTMTYTTSDRFGGFFRFDKTMSINNLIAFLKTQGDVKSISNPKITTINNQPAVISSGDQIYYKLSSTTATTTTATTTASSEVLGSVFAGILLDITPQINDQNEIMLKINPTISKCRDSTQCVSTSVATRTMPPDLVKKEMSAVIKVKEGERIVVGGLISNEDGLTEKKVPLLGDIPLLGYLFKQEVKSKSVKELVIVITTHLISSEEETPTLRDLGYEKLDEKDLSSAKPVDSNMTAMAQQVQ